MKIYLFGRKSIATAILVIIIGFFVITLGTDEEFVMKLYTEIERLFKGNSPFLPNDIKDAIKEKIRNNPKLLDYYVKREVDYSIKKYQDDENKNRQINMKNEVILKDIQSNKYTDNQKKILEEAIYYEFLDGTMGIRGAWVEPDPREITGK